MLRVSNLPAVALIPKNFTSASSKDIAQNATTTQPDLQSKTGRNAQSIVSPDKQSNEETGTESVSATSTSASASSQSGTNQYIFLLHTNFQLSVQSSTVQYSTRVK